MRARDLHFGLSFHRFISYFVNTLSDSSGETVLMHRIASAIAARRCNTFHMKHPSAGLQVFKKYLAKRIEFPVSIKNGPFLSLKNACLPEKSGSTAP